MEERLYADVLSAFGGHVSMHKVMMHKLIVMGSGIRDYCVPAERIAYLLCLTDYTSDPCYADIIGLTVAGIKGAIQESVADAATQVALFKEIEDSCWRESFVEDSSNDTTTIVCSREVIEFLADRLKLGITPS